jgi:hypothetical protein
MKPESIRCTAAWFKDILKERLLSMGIGLKSFLMENLSVHNTVVYPALISHSKSVNRELF